MTRLKSGVHSLPKQANMMCLYRMDLSYIGTFNFFIHSNVFRGRMDSSETDTDLDLVRRTKLGDRHTFDMLVVRHQRMLAQVISRYVKSPQQIEDVTQEAFIKAYRGIMSFRGDSKFSTWLYRIGVNAALSFLAAERSRIPLYEPSINPNTNEPIIPQIVDNESPERLLATQQIGETVSSVLEKLPEELRTAITLREIDGLSYEEIANVMDCPIGTVRSRIFRARESISKVLRPKLELFRDKRW
jgi:RNA polymerase sigma-70 factor (ECF subfamily)